VSPLPPSAPPRRALGSLLLALLTLGVVVGVAAPAQAHPFGDPQTVTLRLGAPDVVRVHWRVGMEDDLTYLAQDLDLLPADRVMLDGAVDHSDADPALLEDSPALDAYLLEHITVSSSGRGCVGSVVDKDDLLDDGVTLDYRCADAVTSADVRVSMLTDLSPAYTTMATGDGGERAVYDGTHPDHTWSLGPASEVREARLGASALVQLGTVTLGLLALALVVGLLFLRRRGRA